MVQFIRGIPKELDEAARIDGCGHWAIFSKVMLPLMGPAIATTAIFTFIWTWSDFFTPLIYHDRSDRLHGTRRVALRSYPQLRGSNWGAMFAMSVVTVDPALPGVLVRPAVLGQGHRHHRGK
jgi:multiple sugar transport system permease protein